MPEAGITMYFYQDGAEETCEAFKMIYSL
jgi:hypothetical protein